jgi:PAS domain S-box-containing protein
VRRRRILPCNKEASRLFGWPHDELPGQPAQVCHPGANDYEAFDRVAAAALVQGGRFETEATFARRDGSRFWAHATGCLVDRDDPHAGTIWIVQDVSARHCAEQRHRAELAETKARLQHLVHHDELTGLPNRRLLIDRPVQSLARAGRDGEQVAVMLIDLDRFKTINDSLGRAVGGELLRAVAHRA